MLRCMVKTHFYNLECKYKSLFAKFVHAFFEMYKVINNYLQ